MKNILYNTPRMINTIKKKGAVGYISIPIDKFLTLTSEKRRERIEKESLTIGDYNNLAIRDKIPTMPYIRITPSGKVIGHEGRHRSYSLKKAGEKNIEVAIIVSEHAGKKQGKGKEKDYGKTYKYKVNELPSVWTAQFSEKTETVNLNSFKRL